MLERKIKKIVKILRLAAISLFLTLLIFLIHFIMQNAELFQLACTQMEAGDYQMALDNLRLMEEYPLAGRKIIICEEYLDSFEHARTLYENHDYQAALDEFLLLRETEETLEMAELCQKHLLHEEAEDIMAEHRRFIGERMLWCRNQILFRDFKELVDQKSYANLSIETINRNYLTEKQRSLISQVEIYLLAVKTKEDGDYAAAFDLFGKILSFDDSKVLRDSCLSPRPDTGILFQNPFYYSAECILTIANGSNPGQEQERSLGDGYVEIYTADDSVLICSLYVRELESVSIDIPAGSYRIHGSFGKKWFGQEGGFFGTSSEEYTYKNADGSEIYELKAYYQDTITIHGRYQTKR